MKCLKYCFDVTKVLNVKATSGTEGPALKGSTRWAELTAVLWSQRTFKMCWWKRKEHMKWLPWHRCCNTQHHKTFVCLPPRWTESWVLVLVVTQLFWKTARVEFKLESPVTAVSDSKVAILSQSQNPTNHTGHRLASVSDKLRIDCVFSTRKNLPTHFEMSSESRMWSENVLPHHDWLTKLMDLKFLNELAKVPKRFPHYLFIYFVL